MKRFTKTDGGEPRRDGRVPRNDRGLPARGDLIDLAKTYLELQRRHWPELVEKGLLPPPTLAHAERLADEFEARFLTKDPVRYHRPGSDKWWAAVAAAYLRYSSDSSNPRSLAQQLRNILAWAAKEKLFIPWEYVFADAAVTGTTAARRGYQMVKEAVCATDGPALLLINELGRASRDAIESLILGEVLVEAGKRLVGRPTDSTRPCRTGR